MRGRTRSRLLLPLALAICVAVPPVPAMAGWWRNDSSSAWNLTRRPARAVGKPIPDPLTFSGPSAQALTATPDAYEAANDGSWSAPGVRDLSAALGAIPLPGVAYVENHTLDIADGEQGDEDWIKFTVPPDDSGDIPVGASVLVEAVTKDKTMFPMIEIWDAGASPSPVAYSSLPLRPGSTWMADHDPGAVLLGGYESWFAHNGASAYIEIDTAGTYYARVRPYYQPDYGQGGETGFVGGAGAYQLRVKMGTGLRIAGSDRYQTAVAASREMFANGKLAGGACVVANGLNFPDALAGSTLAGAVGGPLLLTGPTSLHSAVKAEIQRLGVSTVYILGSTSALSSSVAAAIDAIPGVAFVRVQGSNRYGTARAVALKAHDLSSLKPKVGFLVCGTNFPDALSASPMAAYNVAPIMLTRPDVLSGEVAATIRDLGITDVVVVGGKPAVSDAVMNQAAKVVGAGHIRRIAGANRYATSSAFARWATDVDDPSWDGLVEVSAGSNTLGSLYALQTGVASGLKFPDALAGGTMSGLAFSPLLLVDGNDVAFNSYEQYLNATGGPQTKTYLFGGRAALGDDVMAVVDLLTLPMLWSPIE